MATIGTIKITFFRTDEGVSIQKEFEGVSPYDIVAVGNVLTMEGLEKIKETTRVEPEILDKEVD